MKQFIFTLLLLTGAGTLLGFGQQDSMTTNSILKGAIRIKAPASLLEMTPEMWELKYKMKQRPELVLTNEEGTVNIILDYSEQKVNEAQIAAFTGFQAEQLTKARTDIKILSKGTRKVNGKEIGFIKFSAKAIDQKIFNYYFFASYNGQLLLGSFNCVEKLQKEWEPIAEQIVGSLQLGK